MLSGRWQSSAVIRRGNRAKLPARLLMWPCPGVWPDCHDIVRASSACRQSVRHEVNDLDIVGRADCRPSLAVAQARLRRNNLVRIDRLSSCRAGPPASPPTQQHVQSPVAVADTHGRQIIQPAPQSHPRITHRFVALRRPLEAGAAALSFADLINRIEVNHHLAANSGPQNFLLITSYDMVLSKLRSHRD
jgi:hypothetical protein